MRKWAINSFISSRLEPRPPPQLTQFFRAVQEEKKLEASQVLEQVYTALTEKGYNPINQIVGYIMSGDPTYITSHNNARSLIMKVERDELVEEVLKTYIENSAWD